LRFEVSPPFLDFAVVMGVMLSRFSYPFLLVAHAASE
jgi:hypothetical protein